MSSTANAFIHWTNEIQKDFVSKWTLKIFVGWTKLSKQTKWNILDVIVYRCINNVFKIETMKGNLTDSKLWSWLIDETKTSATSNPIACCQILLHFLTFLCTVCSFFCKPIFINTTYVVPLLFAFELSVLEKLNKRSRAYQHSFKHIFSTFTYYNM